MYLTIANYQSAIRSSTVFINEALPTIEKDFKYSNPDVYKTIASEIYNIRGGARFLLFSNKGNKSNLNDPLHLGARQDMEKAYFLKGVGAKNLDVLNMFCYEQGYPKTNSTE